MLKPDRFSCSQKIRLKRDPPVFTTHCTNDTSIMNPVTFIKDFYKHETLLEARKLEKLEIQLTKSRTSRIFNLRYLENKLTPKTLKIKLKGSKFELAIIKLNIHSSTIESSSPISRSTISKLK